MLPSFDASGLLPPGAYPADWHEVYETFGWNAHRQRLLLGLQSGLFALHEANCGLVYLDGSFTTGKEYPGDYDACYDVSGMDASRLDPVFFHLENGRAAQKLRFGGEYFPSHRSANGDIPFLEFFQVDKESGHRKGIVALKPASAL
jgi:hypothetical protein